MLNWANRFSIFSFLDSNNYQNSNYDWLLAADNKKSVTLSHDGMFETLKAFSTNNSDWLFGHINYPSLQKDEIGFEDGFFFVPNIIIQLKRNSLYIESHDSPEEIFEAIARESSQISVAVNSQIRTNSVLSKEQYIDAIHSLHGHLKRGDCYEINFCQEFFAENATVSVLQLYLELCKISPNPFSAFYKLNEKYCLCASPERFLRKESNRLISQPIKGTSKRNVKDAVEDENLKVSLLNSQKERSENVMIVDLVRNDFSKFCNKGSVKVAELFGIYSFPQVHQMISTIEGEVSNEIHWTDIIDACFPMGSMTGAPKKRVMELIEEYEATPRGLFSGTIGYVTPNGDFDFNVVIRSIFYNQNTKNLSFKAGGGITFSSRAENEYEESLLKVEAIRKLFEAQ